MEALNSSCIQTLHLTKHTRLKTPTEKPSLNFSSFPSIYSSTTSKTKLFSTVSSTIATERIDSVETEVESSNQETKFDWFSQWYPVMPVCDLDKRAPLAKRILGLDVVVWYDRNENEWKVFNDSCPHRLAPLSEGRIDQWGRLQCVYHGWCFNGAGDCKLIPQAPPDGPPINTFKKACVAVYPSTVQNGIVWFWPNTDPQYKDILTKKKPHYFPELDDPSYTKSMGNRDINYGYEVLIENLMDPSHVPYAHYGIMPGPKPKVSVKVDREGGRPMNMSVPSIDINGFAAKQDYGGSKFVPPCIFYAFPPTNVATKENENKNEQTAPVSQKRSLLIFICIPVSPGKSRLIWAFPRNFAVWMDQILPRWYFHVGQNLILDSDLYLVHMQEQKIMKAGPENWQKACFTPTKADALVVAYRKWIKKYSGGQVDWGTKFSASLPPTPPKEELLDRYWSHVVYCSSCRVAYKWLNALEVVLQVISIGTIGIFAATKQTLMPMAGKIVLIAMAVVCFAVSKWLSHFIYKNFHFHDYNHAFV